MKKLLLLLVAVAAIAFTGCSKDDAKPFKYGMETLYGKWKGTAVKIDGNWINITVYPYTQYAFAATFKSDGTYYGEGAFGTGNGTYEASDDTIVTYVDGEEFLSYQVHSIENNVATMTMSGDGESIDIRCTKQ